MLPLIGRWCSHSEYQRALVDRLLPAYQADKQRVAGYFDAIAKLYLLDLDRLKPLLTATYSHTGAPAKHQPEIFRSFILMSELGEPSITKWVARLHSDSLLVTIIGADLAHVPGVGNHYDFITRLWLASPESDQSSLRPFRAKPRKKLGKNQKQPPRHPGIIQKLVDLALQDISFEHRPERLLQQVFAEVVVKPSAVAGLLGNTDNLAVAGDGTCIKTGASPYGVKTCSCASKGIYNCHCPRRFSESDANWGWDSYHETYFYGHSGYFLSVHNADLKVDLPIYLRLLQASRFDGVSAIVALAEFRKLYPGFVMDRFLGDSAHDNYPTYELLNAWRIKPIIALNARNKGNAKFPDTVKVDENGVPICLADVAMVPDGFCKNRCRLKWRCALAMGKITSCAHKDQCSPSDYGRTVYTKPEWDLRLFTPIPRGSKAWKTEMKKRTASERVNKRLLNDYQLEQARARGKKRWSWWLMIHSTNIHLDALIKASKFDFLELLDERLQLAA